MAKKANKAKSSRGLAGTIGGMAQQIERRYKRITPAARLLAATAIAAQDNPEALPKMMETFRSMEQLAIAEYAQTCITSMPKSVRYLGELVDGIHETAPHAVRANAALGIIDRGTALIDKGSVNKDLREMSLAELQQELSRLDTELDGRLAIDAEPADPA